jgi:MYXO-CTERM domain-containing protein
MVLWAATTDNRIMLSQDGGANFTKKLDVPGGWQRVTRELASAPWDEKVAYVAVQRFGTDQVRMTKDLGTSWTAIDGALPDIPANAVEAAVVQSQHMVFVGTDAGVFYTCNDGGKWVRLGTTLPNTVVVDVRYDADFKRVVAATMGRGVWSIEEPAAASCDSDAGLGTGGAGGMAGAAGRGGGAPGSDSGVDAAAGGAGGSGGQGGAIAGAGGTDTGGSANGGAIGAGGMGGTVRGTGPAGAGPGGSGQDTGCACTMSSSHGGAAATLSALGVALLFRRRRSKRS